MPAAAIERGAAIFPSYHADNDRNCKIPRFNHTPATMPAMSAGVPPTTFPAVNTVAMLRPAGHPDGWRQVTAPGGYQWWYFDAESIDGRTHIVAIFLEGFVFHPGYLRQYDRYIRRPNKTPPPLPGNFPCAYFVIYRDGRILEQFITQFPSAAFAAATDRPEVSIGPNRMWLDENTAYQLRLSGTPWRLTARGPQLSVGKALRATLNFRPTWNAVAAAPDRRFLSRKMTGADHHWVLAAPHCQVSGRIELGTGETVPFAGRGYHDHNYGTGPIGPGLRRWIWGRALGPEDAVAFHIATPTRADLPLETHILHGTPAGNEAISAVPRIDWSRRSSWRLAYPAEVELGEALRLSSPRVIDSAPFYLRVLYEARTFGRAGRFLCEVAHPHRLRLPILGRMVEMSIDKRLLKKR